MNFEIVELFIKLIFFICWFFVGTSAISECIEQTLFPITSQTY